MAAPRQGLPSLVDDPRPAIAGVAKAPQSTEKSREPSPRRQKFMLIGAIVAIAVAAVLTISSLRGGSDPAEAARRRVVIDSQTGEVTKEFRIVDGASFPYRNPKTGESTLYPAESCYWNADGTAKLEPTHVFVKSYAGEPGDTKCPDCGRKVVPHNPMPPDDLMTAAIERAKQSTGQ